MKQPMDYQQVCKIIIALYCKNKNKPEKCQTFSCETGKCICIDEEQVELLASRIGYDSGAKLNEKILCEDQKTREGKLISCGRIKQDFPANSLTDAVGTALERVPVWIPEILGTLPVIQEVNASNEIKDRDTLCYLCLFCERGGEYLKKILLDEIVCLLRFCRAGKKDESEQEGKKIVRELERLQNLYQKDNFKNFYLKLDRVIDSFIEAFEKEERGIVDCCWEFGNYQEKLERRYEKYDEKSGVYRYIIRDGISNIEIGRLSRFLEKVAKKANVNLGNAYQQFFASETDVDMEHNIYSQLEFLLEKAKGDSDILSDLEDLFQHSEKLEDDTEIESLINKYNI